MDRCEACSNVSACPICGAFSPSFDHVGVRGTKFHLRIPLVGTRVSYDSQPSGIWHYARACLHRVQLPHPNVQMKYNAGPLWQNGYQWQNVFWGSYFAKPSASQWTARVERAVANIEADNSDSGGLAQYGVGRGNKIPAVIIKEDPAIQISNSQMKQALTNWITSKSVASLRTKGAYNIFLSPGTSATLSSDMSCNTFCDYHDSVDGVNGPFFTVEPYPCTQGCNECTNDLFDTLTQGLSEEMVELKTDMDPGSGWVIGNEELCDFCDTNFACNRLSTGEYVNAWYDNSKRACWIGAQPK